MVIEKIKNYIKNGKIEKNITYNELLKKNNYNA